MVVMAAAVRAAVAAGSDSGSGNSGGSDAGGAAGATGDGAELSPFANAQCEFVLDPHGDTALEDLLLNGAVDRPDLQPIAAAFTPDAGIPQASARLFPHGLQRLGSNRQPLRTTTDAQGAYFLPVPAATAGFVSCTPGPLLTVSAFVPARQPGEILLGQDVSPSSQIFTSFIFPQLPSPAVQAVKRNFLTDIGALHTPSGGIVRMETVTTPAGRMIADTDGDGLVCSLRIRDPQEGAIQYVDAGAMSYTAIALFKALLIEARNPAGGELRDDPHDRLDPAGCHGPSTCRNTGGRLARWGCASGSGHRAGGTPEHVYSLWR